MIYLDYAATTPVSSEVLDTFNKVTEQYWYNSNSPHAVGLETKKLIDISKNQVMKLLDVSDKYEVIFTSTATEANNLAINGYLSKYIGKNKHIITSKGAHPSVYNTYKKLEDEGFKVTYLELNQFGSIDTEALKTSLTKDTVLCSLLLVNNELGTINDIKSITELIRENSNSLIHFDVVQGIGKVKFDIEKNDVDFATCTAHKIHGLKGTGALIKKKNIAISPQITGGYSDGGYVAGTSNVASIVAFAKALRIAYENYDTNYEIVEKVSNYLLDKLKENERIHLNIELNNRVPHIINFSISGVKPETVVNALSEHRIYISTKSACSSKSLNESRALNAMGYKTEISAYSLRVSVSHTTTYEEIDTFTKALNTIIDELCKKK